MLDASRWRFLGTPTEAAVETGMSIYPIGKRHCIVMVGSPAYAVKALRRRNGAILDVAETAPLLLGEALPKDAVLISFRPDVPGFLVRSPGVEHATTTWDLAVRAAILVVKPQ
jgi:hypothetical protein